MAKQTGIGDNFYVDQYDLSGDVGAIQSLAVTRATLDLTGIDKAAPERALGQSSTALTFAAWYNPSAGQSHPVLNQLPNADLAVSYFRGTAFGDEAASLLAKQASYAQARGADGSLALTIEVQNTGVPLEWGKQHTAGKQTFSAAGTTTALDGAAATTLGASAYLHAFAITSGTATVAVQDSADGSSGWANVTGLVFTNVTAATKERVATAAGATVRRYTRLNVTGTFSNLVCAVNVRRVSTGNDL